MKSAEYMDMSTNRRYPGSQPFQREQQHIFFGRNDDIERLYTTVNVNPLTVLHGKSGLGKSSLLNAGVIPRFASQNRYVDIPLRFFPYDGKKHTDPLAEIRLQFLAIPHKALFFADLRDTASEPSLWQLHKTLEWTNRERAGLLLVFDQFEELFSYPENKIEAFAREFADMVLNRMPARFQESLYERMDKENDFAEHHAAELGFIEEQPLTKLIVSIRSDRLSFLDRLKPYLPNILKNTYELQPLSRLQAREAIERPAKSADAFDSPPFEYAPETLKAMLDYLTSDDTKPVESTQLQVICQYAENKVSKPGHVLSVKELGDISEIYKNHYNAILHSFEPEERLRVSHLVEDGLIYESEKRRLSLFEGQILETYQIKRESLAALVNMHHLLRVEPLSTGGFSYEISHDSLVEPILHAKEIRVAAENRKRREQEEKERVEKERELESERVIKQQRVAFFRYSVIVTAFALLALVMVGQVFSKQKELKQAQRDLKVKQDSVVKLLQGTQKSNDSITELNQQLRLGNYRYFITVGNGFYDQKEFRQAKQTYQKALDLIQNDQDIPQYMVDKDWLARRIRDCDTGQKRREIFEALLASAQQAMDAENYLEAYPVYVKAAEMDYDPAAVIDKIKLCQSRLEARADKNLRRVEALLDRTKHLAGAKQWAKNAIKNDIDPILTLILDEKRRTRNILALQDKRNKLYSQATK